MHAAGRSRMEPIKKSACLPRRLAVAAILLAIGGCKHQPSALRTISGDEFAVAMPLASGKLGVDDVTLVAQPPVIKREVIPTPAGKLEPKREIVPAPMGEAEPKPTPTATSVSPNAAAKMADATQPAHPISNNIPAETTTPPPAATEPEGWETWPTPQLVLFITGNQHGYIEPCGCTGLENQKGGMARRFTLMKQLGERSWPLVSIDAGNQVRRTGRQAEIKFQAAASGLAEMKYAAVGFGPDDLKLGVGELIAVAATDDPQTGRFVSANVVLIDPSLMAQTKVIASGGRRVGVTTILDPATIDGKLSDEIQVEDIAASMQSALADLATQQADYKVLTYYGEEDAAIKAIVANPGFDLLIVSGGFGEPMYQAQTIEGSATKLVVTGNKGMYAGLVGLYADEPIRYARVPLSHEFEDAPEMRRLMASYQSQLEALGLGGLGLKPVAHPSGNEFVGTKACGECHKTAYEVWESSAHAQATEHLVHPGERSDISRHFDPECISCHVTGWNAQNYYPYLTGYLSLETSSHLTGNGCENCHGPGASHAAAEQEDSAAEETLRDSLRAAMRLPLDKAKERCMECHDLDNSPDFHKEGAFEDYWAEVEHYGLD